jgi:hypothetical protein
LLAGAGGGVLLVVPVPPVEELLPLPLHPKPNMRRTDITSM